MEPSSITYKDIVCESNYRKLMFSGMIDRFGDSVDAIAFTWLVWLMQLNLSENIKRCRKEMGLTQEELADFFNISVDVLLGYSISSKSVNDIIQKLYYQNAGGPACIKRNSFIMPWGL